MQTRALTVTGLMLTACMVFLAISGVRTLDTHEASLYERLGGKVGVAGVLDHFVANVADDGQLGARFTAVDMDWLRALLTDWVCETGGPCHTDGTGQPQADDGVDFADDAFELMTHHFAEALLDSGVAGYEHFAAMRLFVDTLMLPAPGDG